MSAAEPRCSESSEGRGEPLYGTASTVRNWLFIEEPGPWGRNALMESRLPAEVARSIASEAKANGVRVVLIRRGARMAAEKRNVYFARTDQADSWLTHLYVEEPKDLLDLDLSTFKDGRPVRGSEPVPHPLILVCTHGRHDTCCSIRGNQVSRLACNAYPGLAWECSHIGGDRFAANVVCFPDGVYYGRVGPAELIDVVEAYGKGWLTLEHYRGRSAYPFDVQAAEYFLRRDHGLLTIDDVRLEDFARGGALLKATFEVPQGRAEVQVRVGEREGRYRLTCDARQESAIPSYELISCDVRS